MLATAFGAYGVLGVAMLYTAILLCEYELWVYLRHFGWTGVFVGNAVVAIISYAYIVYGLEWLFRHIGVYATYGTTALLAFGGLIFLYHALTWILQSLRR